MSTVTVKSYRAPNFNEREILRYAKIGDLTEETSNLLQSSMKEVLDTAVYRACFAEFPISIAEDTIIFPFSQIKSSYLARHLNGCSAAILLVSTVGVALDRLIEKYKKVSPAKAFVINSVCTERIETLTDSVQAEICCEYEARGYLLTERFSPGYGDFPLDFQKDIFSALAPEKNLGVTLNSSLSMSPSKSVSAIIGVKTIK